MNMLMRDNAQLQTKNESETPSRACLASLASELAVSFESDSNGQTWLSGQFHTAPLKIAKSFRRPDRGLHAIIMDVSPGLMDGDRYDLDWRIGSGAQVSVTNQSFTKVHPSPYRGARQSLRIRVEDGARFDWLPEPVMLYRDADFTGETEVDLAPGSSLLMTEIVCAGRRLRGERFAFRRYDAALTVRYDGELIYYNRQKVEPGGPPFNPAAVGGWDDCSCFGTLYLFGDGWKAADLSARLHERLIAENESSEPGVRFGISETYKHGIALMALSPSVSPLQALLNRVVVYLREWIAET